MVTQKTRNENKGSKGRQYARSEEELYKKAIELLDKCKIATEKADRSRRSSEEGLFPATVQAHQGRQTR
jgi:hypothetical protein